MTLTEEYLIQVLSDYLNGRVSHPRSELDWQAMLHLGKSHQLEGILYIQCKQYLPEEAIQPLGRAFALATHAYYNRVAAVERAESALRQAGIPFFTVKGVPVAQLYPSPALRTMGDTDLVVHSEDRERACETLTGLGFQDDGNHNDHEWHLRWGKLDFELHEHLVYDEVVTQPRHEAFFNDCWRYVQDGQLDWSFHFLFLVWHLHKHFLNSGVGFRQFLDLFAVVQRCETLDWPWIREKLEYLELLPFTRTCLALIKRWFGISSPLSEKSLDEAFYRDACQKILSNGVFGFQDVANHENRLLNQYSFHSGRSISMRIRLFLGSAFPPYEQMRYVTHYRFLNNRPWLLPVAWVYRVFYGLTHRKSAEVKRMVNQAAIPTQKLNRRNLWLEQWGLGGTFLPSQQTKMTRKE